MGLEEWFLRALYRPISQFSMGSSIEEKNKATLEYPHTTGTILSKTGTNGLKTSQSKTP